MRSLILRPLAVFTITFYVLSCILFTADSSFMLASAVIFSLLFIAALTVRAFIPSLNKKDLKGAAARTLLFFLAGCALASVTTFYTLEIKLSRYHDICQKDREITGTVTDVIWDGGYNGIYKVRVDSVSDSSLSPFSCILYADGGIKENTSVSATVYFSPLESSSDFDERTYYLSQNVYLKGDTEGITILNETQSHLTSFARMISDRLAEKFYKYLGNDEGGFAATLLLGNKARLPNTVNRDFKRLGLSHVLAISGMHLAILCAFIIRLLSPFGKKAINAGCVILVLFYIFVTGFAPTVVRSGIMVLLPIVAAPIHKSTDRFTLLGVTVFLICIINPYSAADMGLQLSFAAMCAIILYTGNRYELKSSWDDLRASPTLLSKIRKALISFLKEAFLSALIILFMLPLTWLYFKQICPAAPLIGPVFSFFCSILLWALPILLILSPAPTLSAVFAYPIKVLISCITGCAEYLSSMENITFSISYPFAPLFCILIFISVIAFCISKMKKRTLCAFVSLILIFAFIISCAVFSRIHYDDDIVSMLTYKSNDGLCLVSRNKAMIIDMGNGYSGILKDSVTFLQECRATEVEVLMLTHYHNAYYSTIDSYLSKNIVRKLLIPYTENGDLSFIEGLGDKHKVPVEIYYPNDSIVFEDTVVIPWENTYIKRSVQPIIRIDVKANGKALTYVGSSYFEAYPDTFIDCDQLFLGGHGPLYKISFTPNVKKGCYIYASPVAEPFVCTTDNILTPTAVVLN